MADLRRAAAPSLLQRAPMTPDDATAIRVAALVVARATDDAAAVWETAHLIGLAAATCLLTRRAARPEELETLILVHD